MLHIDTGAKMLAMMRIHLEFHFKKNYLNITLKSYIPILDVAKHTSKSSEG